MRKLIVIAADQYVRNMVSSGAFDEILDGSAKEVSAPRLKVRFPPLRSGSPL